MDNGLKSQYNFRLSAPLFPYGIERMKTKKQDQKAVTDSYLLFGKRITI